MRGAGLSFVGSVLSAALGFVLTVALARGLGDAGAGVVFQVIGLVMIAGVAAKVGLDSAALWQVPRLVLDEPASLRALVRLLLGWALLGGLVCAAGLWLWAGLAHEGGSAVAAATRAVSWSVPLLALVLVGLAVVRALGGLTSYVTVGNILLPALRPALVVAAVVAGGGALGAAQAWSLALIPSALALGLVLRAQLRRVEVGDAHAPGAGRAALPVGRGAEVARFALPRAVASVLEQVLVWAPVLVLGLLADDGAAGRYATAARFVAVGLLVDAALRVVVAPRFSALLHTRDLPGAQDLYRTTAGWLVAFGTPGFVLLAIYAPTVLGWLGPDFVAAAPALRVLCLGTCAVFLAGNVHTVLLMGGHPGWAMVNKGLALATLLVGLLVLVPAWGVVGAAWAWGAAISLDAALALAQVRRLVGLRHGLWGMSLPLALGALTAGVPALLAVLAWGQGLTALVVGGATALVLFLGAAALLRTPLRLEVRP